MLLAGAPDALRRDVTDATFCVCASAAVSVGRVPGCTARGWLLPTVELGLLLRLLGGAERSRAAARVGLGRVGLRYFLPVLPEQLGYPSSP